MLLKVLVEVPRRTLRFHLRSYVAARVNPATPNCAKAADHGKSVALIDQNGVYTYEDLLQSSQRLAHKIKTLCAKTSQKPNQNCIAYLCTNDASYVVSQWAAWLSGNIAVPLHKSHPTPQLEYFIKDSRSAVVIATSELKGKVEPVARDNRLPLLEIGNSKSQLTFDDVDPRDAKEATVDNLFYQSADALMIYTSGTTGPPKGVLLTHTNLQAQVETIVEALRFTKDDCVLHVLPLHHTHGIVHALLSPLHVGARLMMLPQFNASEVWNRLLSPKTHPDRVNTILAVPTMYVKLIEEYAAKHGGELDAETKRICREKMRVMVCGSSALPQPIFEKWEAITGHRILERYGMTEIGLALTNPYSGPRKPGFVGNPIGCVEVCLAAENSEAEFGYDVVAEGSARGTSTTPGKEGEAGELYVKGPNVFKEYFGKPEATAKTFSKDGWFKTGDTVSYREGSYKIEGRTSVDIIKSGGYKISALEVERHLLSHPNVADVVVVGVPDPTWGQRVAAVVVTRDAASELALADLRTWCKERMPPYTVPSVLKVLESLPKNAVGKVNKKELVKDVFPEYKA